MKFITSLFCMLALAISTYGSSGSKALFVTLDGKIMTRSETKKTANPYLEISQPKSSRGVVLFLQGNESSTNTDVSTFQQLGYAVACLHGSHGVGDAIKAYRLIKSGKYVKGNAVSYCIAGSADGAKLAALTEYKTAPEEQPDQLILINPTGFEATRQGTVFPEINPPFVTKTKLLLITDTITLAKTTLKAAEEYYKTWIGYDGIAFSKKIANAQNISAEHKEFVDVLTSFLNGDMHFAKAMENPAAMPVKGYMPQRHAEKLELLQQHKYDLLFVGNSITNNFEKPEYQAIWEKYFGSRNALNLGYSGYRTENIIWNIENGELDGQSPRVIILEIGTNNIDEKNYPTRHTAGQLAGGIETIVKIFREKCPDAKIILLRCFPGCYGGPNPTSHRRILERASDIVQHLADNKHIFYCDVNHVFLNMDGSIQHDLMPDWLHPSPAGAELWAQTMEPLLSKLMNDSSRVDHTTTNTAIVPVPKLEDDSYDWWTRHNDVMSVKDSLNPDIVLIGNSITHFWGGNYPPLKYADGTPRQPNGPESWRETFGNHRVLNLGFGWDRTQNVLWRLDHGELDGLDPKLVVIHIGTNNTSETEHARMNTAPEIVEGIKAICLRVRSKVPEAKIVLMQIMPREEMPDHPRRMLINATNEILQKFAKENDITLLDISSKMLTSYGVLKPGLTFDFCHPTDAGYQIWGEALRPYIENIGQ